MDSHPLFEQTFEYERCNSTISKARNMLASLEGNALFITKEQMDGKGRKGNLWFSPRGGLWFTMAIKDLDVPSGFTLFIGQCLHMTLRKITRSKDILIKWPNDIYYKEKKVAGIIVEKVHNYHLIGVGVNTNCVLPECLHKTATSLHKICSVGNQEILFNFLDYFQFKLIDYLEQGLDEEYLNRFSFLRNKKVTFGTEFANYQGVVRSINKEGEIVLLLDNGLIQPFFSGSIINFSRKEK